MSSYAEFRARGKNIFSFRNAIPPTFLFLFTQDTVMQLVGEAAKEIVGNDPDYDDEPFPIYLLRATVSDLRDRLDSLGIGRKGIEGLYLQLRASEQEPSPFSDHESLKNFYLAKEQFWRGKSFDSWVVETREQLDAPVVGRPDPMELRSLKNLLSIWEYVEDRFALRALLETLESDETVDLDITALMDSGWLGEPFDPQASALEEFSYPMANGTPPIVLTEGSTDAQALQMAIRVLKPHLATYIRFPDFSTGAEGGAPAMARTLKAFAAAGISNRVFGLFDNDTAASEVIRTLQQDSFPKHFSVLQLPELPLAGNYPAIGPSGTQLMNVNGLAGSLELFMGEDCLRAADGNLRPVQWRGYSAAMPSYQGEVLEKAAVREYFDKKAKQAIASPALIATQDWSGMQLILDTLLERLADAELH